MMIIIKVLCAFFIYYYKLRILKSLLRHAFRITWDRSALDALKIAIGISLYYKIHFAHAIIVNEGWRKKKSGEAKSREAPATFDRWRSAQLAGRKISRRRTISACTYQKMIGAASQNAGVSRIHSVDRGCIWARNDARMPRDLRERNAECHFPSRGAFARAAFYDLRSTKAASHREVAQCGRRSSYFRNTF